MKKVSARSLKVNCLAIVDQVQATREPVLITKRGKPIAKLLPADVNSGEIFNFFAGKGSITGDIVSPVLSLEDWGEPE